MSSAYNPIELPREDVEFVKPIPKKHAQRTTIQHWYLSTFAFFNQYPSGDPLLKHRNLSLEKKIGEITNDGFGYRQLRDLISCPFNKNEFIYVNQHNVYQYNTQNKQVRHPSSEIYSNDISWNFCLIL